MREVRDSCVVGKKEEREREAEEEPLQGSGHRFTEDAATQSQSSANDFIAIDK